MDFPDFRPSPITPFAYSIQAIIWVPAPALHSSGSRKCDLAPLIAGRQADWQAGGDCLLPAWLVRPKIEQFRVGTG